MKTKDNNLLRLIAVFKLAKAITLVAVGFGALHLLHQNDAAEKLYHLIATLGLNPGGRYVDEALAKVVNLPPKDFRELGIGSFVYAALFLIEGFGLWFAKRWAEWFTAIITGSLVPLEVFEIYRHPTIAKVVVLLLNVAIVVYLIWSIRKADSGGSEGRQSS